MEILVWKVIYEYIYVYAVIEKLFTRESFLVEICLLKLLSAICATEEMCPMCKTDLTVF